MMDDTVGSVPALAEGAKIVPTERVEMSEERLQILRMVQEGKISVEEGARLIDALNEPGPPPPAPWELKRGKTLRIRVEDADGSKVNLNIPVALASLAARFIPKGALTVDGEEISVEEIIQIVREGSEGKILQIEEADGSKVEVTVE